MKLSDLFSNYFTVRKELVAAVANLSEDQLSFTAPNHANSIGWLLNHIGETEGWWITTVAVRQNTNEPYDSAAWSYPASLDVCLSRLEETFAATTRFLEEESVDDWDEVFYRVRGTEDDGREVDYKVSKRWLVWHVIEHQARHRGQIFMLLRMQGLEVPNV